MKDDRVRASAAAQGSLMRAIREDLHMSQATLAARLETNQSTVSRMESGERELRLFDVLKLAEAFETNALDLYLRFKMIASFDET